MRQRGFVWAVVVAWCGLSTAAAQSPSESINEASRLFLEVADFDGAKALLIRTLASSELNVESAAAAHRYLAAIELALDERAAAQEHAAMAVALDGRVEAPPGTGDLGELLVAAHQAQSEPSRLALTTQDGFARLVLEPSSPAIVSQLRIRCGDVEARGAISGVAVELPEGSIDCFGEGVSSGGALLLRTENASELDIAPTAVAAQARPIEAQPVVQSPTDAAPSSGGLSRGAKIAIAASAVAVLVIVLAIAIAVSRQSDNSEISISVEGWN